MIQTNTEQPVSKKLWTSPEFYILDTEVNSGMRVNLEEATLRSLGASPPITAPYVS
jgi:hypothetical protein